jgi:hypothetical protein
MFGALERVERCMFTPAMKKDFEELPMVYLFFDINLIIVFE